MGSERLRPLRLTSDPELVALARSGSDDAFGELTRRHRSALLGRCTRLVGRDSAEDAVQDTLLKALVALRSDASPPAEIRAWLGRVAHNVSIDLLRRRALEPGASPASEEFAATGEPPIDVLERRRELRSIVREIGRLPERQRQALVLRAVEGHGYEQIAEALEASEGMVRQLIYRARERVRAGAAAALCPPWLLRMLHRGTPPGHELAAGGGVLAGGGAMKLGAVVTAAGLALGGATIARHAGAGAPESAHAAAAAPAAKHASHRASTKRHGRAAPARHPRSAGPAAKRRAAGNRRVRVVGGGAQVATLPVANAAPGPSRPTGSGSGGGSAQPAPHAEGGVQGGFNAPPAAPAHPSPSSGGDDQHPTSSSPPPAASPPPAPSPEPPPPSGPAAPAVNGHVTGYEQSPGFGGPLTIQRSNGETITAYFGELVTLNCYFVRDGHVVEHSQCTKERLQAGTPVTLAEHSVNSSGHDVWTHVELVLSAP